VEEVVEMRERQEERSPNASFFPGYVLVEMLKWTDDTWHLIKNTSKVTGFVGGSAHNRQRPISEKPKSMKPSCKQMQEGC
jgi:transcriptional antiterminator NusG